MNEFVTTSPSARATPASEAAAPALGKLHPESVAVIIVTVAGIHGVLRVPEQHSNVLNYKQHNRCCF